MIAERLQLCGLSFVAKHPEGLPLAGPVDIAMYSKGSLGEGSCR